MKIKYFAGSSIINVLISRVVLMGVQWRLWSLRLKNKLKAVIKREHCQLVNDASAASELMAFIKQGYTKVNIGGGAKNLKGFVNIDFMSHADVVREVKANILDLGFIPDDTLSQVHSNHVAEHLTADQFKEQLAQYYRIMKPQGVLTIRCPNVLGVCFGFWFEVVPEVDQEVFVALGFPEDEDFCHPLDGWYHKNLYGFVHWVYGDAGNISNQHLNMFTPSKMKKAVVSAGFDVIKISEPESSNIIIVAQKR